MNRQMVAAAIAVVVIPLLAACSGSRADLVASARELDGAPDWVQQPVGEDCGQVEVNRSGELPRDAMRCLDEIAEEGQRGTLALISRTTEGDPGLSFVLVDGSTVKLASTPAFDSYGGESGWREQACTDIAALPACR